jgi:hypothetical protein
VVVTAAIPLAKSLGAVERRDALLDLAHGGIAVTAVLLPLGIRVASGEIALEVRRVRKGVGRRLRDRRREGVGGALAEYTRMHGFGRVRQSGLHGAGGWIPRGTGGDNCRT